MTEVGLIDAYRSRFNNVDVALIKNMCFIDDALESKETKVSENCYRSFLSNFLHAHFPLLRKLWGT